MNNINDVSWSTYRCNRMPSVSPNAVSNFHAARCECFLYPQLNMNFHYSVCLSYCKSIASFFPKRFPKRMRYDSSSFKLPNILFSLTSFSSCLRLIPHLLLPSIFPSIPCFRRQFLRKMWPIQLAFLRFIVCTWLCVILSGLCTERFPVPWKHWRRDMIM